MSKKKIGIWIRVSDVKQVQKESNVHHEVRAKSFVKARGWTIRKTYRLDALSGKSVMGYSETQRMLNDIQTGVISGLVFSKISRLARNTKELIEISEIFRECEADLISMDMSIDTSTPIGRHFFRQMSSMAEWEREMIVERVNNSIETRAKLGKHLGGQPPFGYTYVDKKLVVHEDEASICRLIFQTFLETKRKRTTARILNEKGYRTRLGKNFSHASMARILTDSVYKGLRRMNYSRLNSKGRRVIKPKEEWVFHKAPPIISEDLWGKVNNIILNQLKSYKQPLNSKVHLFTSFVVCSCGGKMVTRNNSKNYICLDKCGNRIHKEDLEEVFRSELHNYTISPENLENYFKQRNGQFTELHSELETLEKEKNKLEKKISNLIDLHSEGQIETDAFSSYHQKPYLRLNQIIETIAEINEKTSQVSMDKESTALVFEEAENLYENWHTLTHEHKRSTIETITENIIVSKDEITINLYAITPKGKMPTFSELKTNGPRNP